MKQLLLRVSIVFALTSPVFAEEPRTQDEDIGKGLNLLDEGARMILRGLSAEIVPWLEELTEAIDDINAYQIPEVLPNGDILIRRKPSHPFDPKPQDDAAEGIEL